MRGPGFVRTMGGPVTAGGRGRGADELGALEALVEVLFGQKSQRRPPRTTRGTSIGLDVSGGRGFDEDRLDEAEEVAEEPHAICASWTKRICEVSRAAIGSFMR